MNNNPLASAYNHIQLAREGNLPDWGGAFLWCAVERGRMARCFVLNFLKMAIFVTNAIERHIKRYLIIFLSEEKRNPDCKCTHC